VAAIHSRLLRTVTVRDLADVELDGDLLRQRQLWTKSKFEVAARHALRALLHACPCGVAAAALTVSLSSARNEVRSRFPGDEGRVARVSLAQDRPFLERTETKLAIVMSRAYLRAIID
jgi:hypothetical protein